MRIPLAGNISTKDGATNKNSRLYNVLAETRKDGKVVAGVRPGLNVMAETSGNGNGIVCFNGELFNVFGATLGVIETATPDYTHVICLESTNTIWLSVDWVGTELVGVGGTGADIRQSSDNGETTSLVSTAPVEPDFPHGLINKNGQLYLLKDVYTTGAPNGVYRDNSDYGATWSYVGANAVQYPSCVSGSNIYSLTLGELIDEESEETIGFTVQVHTTTDLTSITASTSVKNVVGDFVSVGYGCMTVIGGVIHVLAVSDYSDTLYHFKYQGGTWTQTRQTLAGEYIPSSKRCYEINGDIYFITVNSTTGATTLRKINPDTDLLETYYALGAVSIGGTYQQLIYNGTTLTVCLRFTDSMEYHHFSNITDNQYQVTTTSPLDENTRYDFALIP